MTGPVTEPATEPAATLSFVTPDPGSAVLLDRVVPGGPKPDYCIHGKATCVSCHHWVWLGSETVKVVSSGRASPLCRDCASVLLPGSKPVEQLHDRRRAEGPH